MHECLSLSIEARFEIRRPARGGPASSFNDEASGVKFRGRSETGAALGRTGKFEIGEFETKNGKALFGSLPVSRKCEKPITQQAALCMRLLNDAK
jgi:hypothetical protein